MLGVATVAAGAAFAWALAWAYHLALETNGAQVRTFVNGQKLYDVVDADAPLRSCVIALVVADGCFATRAVAVRPLVL